MGSKLKDTPLLCQELTPDPLGDGPLFGAEFEFGRQAGKFRLFVKEEMNDIGPYIKFARPLYDGRDPGHDFRHIERIISRLDELSEDLNPAPVPHKLFFLACFHGLGQRILKESDLRENSVAFLEGLGWVKSEIEVMLSSLESHLRDPKTVEEMMVHDANYYEIAGAFGIAKAFTVGGSHGQSYETTIERYERFLSRARFRTPYGRRNYEPRKFYVWEFLRKLRDEL